MSFAMKPRRKMESMSSKVLLWFGRVIEAAPGSGKLGTREPGC
jgi:hypothetical protein